LDYFDSYRSQFPITENHVFLNHAAISPIPIGSVKKMAALLEQIALAGGGSYSEWMEEVEAVRTLVAALLSCKSGELAFTGNTSEGLSAVATGLTWRKGDIVLIPAPEFPANLYPWVNLASRGVGIRAIQRKKGCFYVEDLEKALEPRTRLLSVSSVDFSTGFRCDLEALGDFCKRKGLLFCVDGTQSVGVLPMDPKKSGAHFLAVGGHKWLLSPMGCAILYISEEVNHLVHPERVGWKSVIDEENFFQKDFRLKPDALRFEPGSMNVPGIYALGAAIRLLNEAGLDRVNERILFLNNLLIQGLKDRNMEIVSSLSTHERSGILSFLPEGDPEALLTFLKKRNIIVSVRNGMIRLSPHFYNNSGDVALFFEGLDRFASR
jgi:cysteine desulfurase/selenocysteine lyase